MPGKLRIYLDTSVISACVDTREVMRQQLTSEFWRRLPSYQPCISPLVVEEIRSTVDPVRRDEMLFLARPLTVIEWQPEMEELSGRYVAAGAFAPAMRQDARHVAACTVAGIPVLLSWNFRHLVNRTRRIRVNLVNSEQGYGQLEIIAPPELE
jgi:hypothetical protein